MEWQSPPCTMTLASISTITPMGSVWFFLVLSQQSHCSFTVKSSQHYNQVYLMNRWWLWTAPGSSTAIRLPQMESCMSLTVLSVLLEAQSRMSLRLMMTWQLWAWVATLKNKSNYTRWHRDSEWKLKLCIGLQENFQDLEVKMGFFSFSLSLEHTTWDW